MPAGRILGSLADSSGGIRYAFWVARSINSVRVHVSVGEPAHGQGVARWTRHGRLAEVGQLPEVLDARRRLPERRQITEGSTDAPFGFGPLNIVVVNWFEELRQRTGSS